MGLRVFVLVGCVLMSMAASPQDRDGASRATHGRLSGRVIGADTGRPIARAQVSLMRASDTRPSLFAVSDDTGGFAFDRLPEGRYTLAANKRGVYLETVYGRTSPDLPPKVLSISAGTETSVDIPLVKAGAISGRIFDQAGDPVPYAVVTLRRPMGSPPPALGHGFSPSVTMTTATGFVRFGAATGAATNDRGEFRLFGLAPGEYMLYAMTQALQGDTRRYAPIYYPGVADVASAERIELLPGQEIANVDFTLRLTPTVKISGVALTPEGQPVRGGTLALYTAGAGPGDLNQVGSIKADGSFSFEALPGQYLLRARYAHEGVAPGERSGTNLSMAQPLVVGTDDMPGLVLKLTNGAMVSGQMVFEGSVQPADTARFSVGVHSGGPGEIIVANRGENGTFVLRGIESGSKRLFATAPAGWMLKGIYVNGRDVADVPVEFRDELTIGNVRVVFTDALTRLQLTVRYPSSDHSAVVLVFPDDPSIWHDRRIAVRAASAEPLRIDALPAGDYLAVAVSDASLASMKRPDEKLLERLRQLGQKSQLTYVPSVSRYVIAKTLPR